MLYLLSGRCHEYAMCSWGKLLEPSIFNPCLFPIHRDFLTNLLPVLHEATHRFSCLRRLTGPDLHSSGFLLYSIYHTHTSSRESRREILNSVFVLICYFAEL